MIWEKVTEGQNDYQQLKTDKKVRRPLQSSSEILLPWQRAGKSKDPIQDLIIIAELRES